MNPIRKIIPFLVGMAIFIGVAAQEGPKTGIKLEGGLDAEKVLATVEQLQALLPEYCEFTATFKQQKRLVDLPLPLESGGNFLFSCDHGLLWNTVSPFKESFLYTKHNINYEVDSKNVKPLFSALHDGLSKILIRIMRGDVDYIQANFLLSRRAGQADQGGNVFVLSPTNRFVQKAIDEILIFRGGDGRIHYVINDTRRQSTDIEIYNIARVDTNKYKNITQACMDFFGFAKPPCDALRYPGRYQ